MSLAVGEELMNGEAEFDSAERVLVNGQACGSTLSSSTSSVQVRADLPGSYCAAVIEVDGGLFSDSGSWCGGRRKAVGRFTSASASNWQTVTPLPNASSLRIWLGYACDPSDSIGIPSDCVLHLSGGTDAVPTPPPLPTPPSVIVSHAPPPPPPSQPPPPPRSPVLPAFPPPYERWAAVDRSVRHQSLRDPPQLRSVNGILSVHLELGLLHFGFPGGVSQQMASYNGSIPAPTLRLSPGDVLEVHIINGLMSGATNLHMHGLHVSPHEDDTFTEVPPGMGRSYTYHLPSDHHAGTFWYHPHHHPRQTLQAGAGAFGLVIVDDPRGSLPPALTDLPETVLVLHHVTDSACAAAGGAALSGGGSDRLLATCASRTVLGASGAVVLVNGQVSPIIEAIADGWSRWRLLLNAVSAILEPSVPASCEGHLLAKDGVYLPTTPRRVVAAYLAAGSRADWLLSCPAGTHALNATLTWESGETETVHLATVHAHAPFTPSGSRFTSNNNVSGSAAVASPVAPFASPRPCHLADLRGSSPQSELHVHLRGYTINERSYAGPQTSEAHLDLGSVVQLQVSGAHETHPFHLHTHAFQVVSMAGSLAAHASGHFAVGDWHDTLVTPLLHQNEASAPSAAVPIAVRFVTDRFGGPTPLHCHALDHADLGMMLVYNVSGVEGTAAPGCVPSLPPLSPPPPPSSPFLLPRAPLLPPPSPHSPVPSPAQPSFAPLQPAPPPWTLKAPALPLPPPLLPPPSPPPLASRISIATAGAASAGAVGAMMAVIFMLVLSVSLCMWQARRPSTIVNLEESVVSATGRVTVGVAKIEMTDGSNDELSSTTMSSSSLPDEDDRLL